MQKNTGSRYTLKNKILASLILIPSLILALFLGWSLTLIKDDKLAYIFDSTSSISNSLSAHLTGVLKQTKQQAWLLRRSLANNTSWQTEATNVFANFDTADGVLVYQNDQLLNQYEVSKENPRLNKIDSEQKGVWLKALDTQSDLLDYQEGKDQLVFAFKNNNYKWIFLLNTQVILSTLQKPGPYVVGVLNEAGQLLLSTEGLSESAKGQIPFTYEMLNVTKMVTNKSNEDFLMTYAPLNDFPFTLGVGIKKTDALAIIQTLVNKSVLVFIGLICLSIIAGTLITEQLTNSLNDILAATRKIGQGFFSIKLKIRNRDEVGAIAKGINTMAVEIQKLLKETAEKARIEHEVELAKALQSTFFPTESARYGAIGVAGKNEPTSECSGDWWYHVEHKGRIYFIIGDAVGHGVSAALLTGTVCTAFKLILANQTDLVKITKLLSDTVFSVFRGETMMTATIMEYIPNERLIRYVNASHESGFILPHSPEKLDWRTIECMKTTTGQRLGEWETSEYSQDEIKLNPGDRLFFYTDGILEIKDRNLKELNERNLLQMLTESHFKHHDVKSFIEGFQAQLKEFQFINSPDDVTFVAIGAEE